jgi:alpha-L-fucosidase 2
MHWISLVSAALALAAVGATAAPAPDPLLLTYPKPADAWTEGLAVGNGRLGAMVFGQPQTDRLQLNEITVWSGGPSPEADRPDGYKALPAIRQALHDGDYEAAQRLVGQHMTAQAEYFPSYQTLGDLTFRYTLPGGETTGYRRWLDIGRAVAGVSFRQGGVTFTREVFASAPQGVIALRLSASRKGSLTLDLGLGRQVSTHTVAEGTDTLVMTGSTDYQGHPGAVGYEVRTRVIARGGIVQPQGDHLRIEGADSVTILVAAGTTYVLDGSRGYRGPDPHAQVCRTLAAASARPYEAIRREHIADYRKFFDRVDLSVGEGPGAALPTDQRLRDFKDGRDDPGLSALYYQFGRYLLISSSRPDNPLPSNSQGLWGDGLDMPWKADYKSNINFQMNYWPAETANLGDCHLPMIRLIESLVPPGRRTAQAYFGAPGWACAYTTNAFGWTSPGGGLPWGPFFEGGAWDCRHLWEHYAFTRDRAYLKSVYPVMRESCEFSLAILVPDENGMLITSPSVSPENVFQTDQGVRGSVDAGSAVEREIIWDLFSNTIQASRVLDTDAEFRGRLEAARAKIRPLEIGRAGQLEEWGHDWDLNAPEKDHRHVSHLFALFPGRQITPEGTPALAAAARKSLELRGDDGTGWSKAWKINLWARLHDGDHAYRLLCDQLRLATDDGTHYSHGGGTYADMFDAHPPFQIDGNYGGVSGIDEMLLQSHLQYVDPARPAEDRYIVELLPALPVAWPSGHVRGLRARGGLEVAETWSSGALTSATLRAVTDAVCRVRYRGTTRDLALKAGQTITLDAGLRPA